MTQVAIQSCPHCGAENPADSTFCSACGKSLPLAGSAGPRVLGKADYASTAAGQKLQGDELLKTAKKASGALLAVSVIATLVAVFIVVMFQNLPAGRVPADGASVIIGIQIGVAAIFWGLWLWSRSQPL